MELWYSEFHTDNVKWSLKTKKHLFGEKSEFQQVDVIDTVEFGKMLLLDGLVMCSEKEEASYHEMIAHLPMATNPQIKKVLVIGGGDGGTVREVARFKSVEHIDMVEIDKMVVDASLLHLPTLSCALNDPRVTLYYEDGLEYVKKYKGFYDLILVDSTDPIGPGEGLFTTEFYQDCFDALTENGILVNQNESPFYDNNRKEMKRAVSKLKKVFPVSKMYTFHMGIYPSGLWSFGYASKGIDPIKDQNKEWYAAQNLETLYYNEEIHSAAFALPTYVKKLVLEDE